MQPMPHYHADVPLPPASCARRKISNAANLASEIATLLLSASQDCGALQSARLARLAAAAAQFSSQLAIIARRAK
jgi:hypothetical protein